mmetsp:Transcript_19226/g.24948  ORF Transcript_19226/g.24948 Transcript_19226/m.24948 type:complete len:130 (-) Transcript_19226:80-469(-)
MALGQYLARLVASMTIPMFRAIGIAYEKALSSARREGANAARESLKKRMTPIEAAEVLNLTTTEAKDLSLVEKNFRRIFEANDPKKGGSFYLQSKVYSAHQVLSQKKKAETQQSSSTDSGQNAGTSNRR